MNHHLTEQLYQHNLINAIDFELSEFMGRLAGDSNSEELRLAVALASYQVSSHEHASLDLAQCSGRTLEDFFAAELLFSHVQPPKELLKIRLPELKHWLEKITAAELEPLIIYNEQRLYLRRWWNYEERIIQIINQRLNDDSTTPDEATLDHYGLTGEQRAAAIMALRGNFSIITGGPGTGKTTTFTTILAMLQERSPQPLRIAMAAPSGKAAQRMQEAVDKACANQKIENLTLSKASTIHRLIGYNPISQRLKHHQTNPIQANIVVIDECSMIPLGLLCKLLNAIPDTAQIIMLGDPNQLEPIEVGAAFNDICAAATQNPKLNRRVTKLLKSYRFDATSGIGQLSLAIRDGNTAELENLIANSPEDVKFVQVTEESWEENIQKVAKTFQTSLEAANLTDAFKAFEQCRILSACNRRFMGCQKVNDWICTYFSTEPHYRGLPIMITVNDYNESLFNGDIGMIWSDTPDGPLYAGFPDSSGGFRQISLNLLPNWVPAYATTVHKAQGSEAEQIILLMPSAAAPLLTRELFFTGVTRAQKRVEIWYENLSDLAEATKHSQYTPSGIAEKLTCY